MPLHDWSHVPSSTFHHFHQRWIQSICDGLNAGELPSDYYAMSERNASRTVPDVITLRPFEKDTANYPSGGTAIAEAPPKTRFRAVCERDVYAGLANRIVVRHNDGEVVSVIEIVSPGNKSNRDAFATFVKKALRFVRAQINLLVIDVFPPTKRDPLGIHSAIWRRLTNDDLFVPPNDKPLTIVSYDSSIPTTAYIEPIAAGDDLPEIPLFLRDERYITLPLQPDYLTTWNVLARQLKTQVVNSNSNVNTFSP